MINKRERVGGTTPQDLKKINDNFENLWLKMNGDIDYEDMSENVKEKIMKQYVPFQGEGNMDNSVPLYIRFYLPPNTKSIEDSKFSIMIENFRMDSSVTKGGGATLVEDVSLNANTSSTTVAGSTASGGGTTSGVYNQPEIMIEGRMTGLAITSGASHYHEYINHIPADKLNHTHVIPPHSHTVSLPGHMHEVTGKIKLNIPEHIHDLSPGVMVSSTAPGETKCFINDNQIGETMSGSTMQNDIDVTAYINPGWNIIKVTSTNASRATVYGVTELTMLN